MPVHMSNLHGWADARWLPDPLLSQNGITPQVKVVQDSSTPSGPIRIWVLANNNKAWTSLTRHGDANGQMVPWTDMNLSCHKSWCHRATWELRQLKRRCRREDSDGKNCQVCPCWGSFTTWFVKETMDDGPNWRRHVACQCYPGRCHGQIQVETTVPPSGTCHNAGLTLGRKRRMVYMSFLNKRRISIIPLKPLSKILIVIFEIHAKKPKYHLRLSMSWFIKWIFF